VQVAAGPQRHQADRGRGQQALGIWTGVGAFGATAALLIGGPITDGLGWAWIFFINVPLGLAVAILPGFTMERREDGPLLQLARLALIVAGLASAAGRGDRSRADAAVARRA
jgi:MFS family permease